MGRITDPPKETSSRYPDGHKRKGTVIDATKPEYIESEHGDYAARIELVEWEAGKRAIRFAYYRREKGRKGDDDWTFAGQYTWVFSVDITNRQIEQAKSKGFFG